jgi:hypothetical protein
MQVCTRVRGKAASIASGQPFSLSSTRCTTVGSASCSELRLPLAVVLAPLLPIMILLSAPLCPVTYLRNAGRLSDPIWPSKGPTVAPALSTARHRYLRLPTRDYLSSKMAALELDHHHRPAPPKPPPILLPGHRQAKTCDGAS